MLQLSEVDNYDKNAEGANKKSGKHAWKGEFQQTCRFWKTKKKILELNIIWLRRGKDW